MKLRVCQASAFLNKFKRFSCCKQNFGYFFDGHFPAFFVTDLVTDIEKMPFQRAHDVRNSFWNQVTENVVEAWKLTEGICQEGLL